jgi:hypothetical protein
MVGLCRLTVTVVTVVLTLTHTQLQPYPSIRPSIHLLTNTDTEPYNDNLAVFPGRYTEKKVHEFPVSSRDVTNQTPPGPE